MTAEQYAAHQKKLSQPAIELPKAGEQPSSLERLQALGRLKDGEQNKTEARFEAEWIAPRMMVGEIVWFEFEFIKLKLANHTHLTLDYFLMNSDREFFAVDVKGAKAIVTDDFRAKAKIAAQRAPWRFYMAFPLDRGGWELEQIGI